jgi:hypothetical protein
VFVAPFFNLIVCVFVFWELHLCHVSQVYLRLLVLLGAGAVSLARALLPGSGLGLLYDLYLVVVLLFVFLIPAIAADTHYQESTKGDSDCCRDCHIIPKVFSSFIVGFGVDFFFLFFESSPGSFKSRATTFLNVQPLFFRVWQATDPFVKSVSEFARLQISPLTWRHE